MKAGLAGPDCDYRYIGERVDKGLHPARAGRTSSLRSSPPSRNGRAAGGNGSSTARLRYRSNASNTVPSVPRGLIPVSGFGTSSINWTDRLLPDPDTSSATDTQPVSRLKPDEPYSIFLSPKGEVCL
jgi:hypothetical protein